jgi:hypothetical protein
MTERRGTQDKQLTVSDVVTVAVSSDIATLTVTGSDCTGDNRSIFVLREDKELLNCAATVRFVGGEGKGHLVNCVECREFIFILFPFPTESLTICSPH